LARCDECVEKHIGQAYVLILESEIPAYGHHRIFAIGHLAEAERECADAAMRVDLRECRKAIQEGADASVIEAFIINSWGQDLDKNTES